MKNSRNAPEDRQGQPIERRLAAEWCRAEDQRRDPVLEQDDERGRDDDRGVLGQAGPADPDDLADEQLARRRRADQELHDPGALLGRHARRDPHPVDGQGDEDEHDEHGRQHGPAGRSAAGRSAAPPSVCPVVETTTNVGGWN